MVKDSRNAGRKRKCADAQPALGRADGAGLENMDMIDPNKKQLAVPREPCPCCSGVGFASIFIYVPLTLHKRQVLQS